MKKSIKFFAFLFIPLCFFILYLKFSSGTGKHNEPESTGQLFHEKTSLGWGDVFSSVVKKTPPKPPQFKFYKDKKKIKLPVPKFRGMSVEDAILKRRSIRNYSNKALTLDEFSSLLFSAQGITKREAGLRSVPSAGALYPLEIYIVVQRVEGINKGLYHYNVVEHSIELLKEGDFSSELAKAAIFQEMVSDAAVSFIITAIFDRVCWKYGERGYRYAYIEAGHVSQNIYLQSTSLGLGGVAIGAFFDKKVCEILAIDCKKEAVLYIHPVGKL